MAKVIVQSFLRLGFLVLVLIGMTQIVGAQIKTELKCSADKLYNLYRHNIMQLSTIFPDYLKSIKIVKGDGIRATPMEPKIIHIFVMIHILWTKNLGSIRLWKYVIPEVPSKVMVLKEMIKSVDEENRSITFNVLGGDLMTQYTIFDITITVTPKDIDNIKESGCKVKLWIEYEKRTEDVHSPDAHIGLIDGVIKELDNYLLH
ncbi:hypothetical protein MKX03_020293 [Papaver bracteatum]|nr:hypothetical protein MKX03_020293 [Papaver bracteatum]